MNKEERRMFKEDFTWKMTAKALVSGLLFATLIVLPFFLLVFNLGFLFVHLLRVFAVLFVFFLSLWAFLVIVFFYKTLALYNKNARAPIQKMMWQDGLTLALIILIAGTILAIRLLPAL